mmetsp:Transcript_8475/g.22339  ORF Transcript_8475/g.22339 Transcript_8475/m.22339 type:complete len:174 (-) Transcript_8475:167-688(-)
MLRLAALDIAVVEARLSKLSALLPEADVVSMVSKQPGLLRRDTEKTLRPRLLFLAQQLGEPADATTTVCANPRLLLSSWGVLARLQFVRERVAGGLGTLSPSSTIMMPKGQFERRFDEYKPWLVARIEGARAEGAGDGGGAGAANAEAPISELEAQHGGLLEREMLGALDVER